MSFTIEVVAASLQSCVAAQSGGARRIELCSALSAAGVTPSSGLIQIVRNYVTIPIYVMIRPREGDFCYSRADVEVMKQDIENAKVMGADGIVFGALENNGEVDVAVTKELVRVSRPLPVTFHRAIDVTPDIFEALEAVIACGCTRILTSGGRKSGLDGVEVIHALAHRAAGRIDIMPGGGLTADRIQEMFNPAIRDYHLSGRLPVQSPTHSDLFDLDYAETDAATIREVVKKAKDYFMPANM